jgi:hypothetical protein
MLQYGHGNNFLLSTPQPAGLVLHQPKGGQGWPLLLSTRGGCLPPPHGGGVTPTMKRLLYKLLALSNDVNAVRKGRIGRRIGRRLYGKATGRLAGRIFR